MKIGPSAARVRELLKYDPDTGQFTWRVKAGSKAKGSKAGSLSDRYVDVQLDKRIYRAHRIAWLCMTGEWPDGEIDHINGDCTDNRWSNLRLVSRKANMQNQRRPHSNNGTGYLGVHKQGKWYRSRLHVNGKNISLGLFDTPEKAHRAYLAAKRQHHEGCAI